MAGSMTMEELLRKKAAIDKERARSGNGNGNGNGNGQILEENGSGGEIIREKGQIIRKFQDIRDRINSGEWGQGEYYLCEPSPGDYLFLFCGTGDGVVEICREAKLANVILKNTEHLKGFNFTPRMAQEAAKYYMMTASVTKEPAQFRLKSDPGLCFQRLSFDLQPDFGEHPLFDELLSRMTNKDAIVDWLGSLFDLESDRSQYVWVYGDGLNGKTSLLKMLKSVFGKSYASLETPHHQDRFWSMQLIGKRLVGFEEVSDQNFVTSAKFKNLTGNENIFVEAKGKMGYNVNINSKFIFCSNEKPNISSARADLRRAIYCFIEPIVDLPQTNYVDRLIKEAPAILSNCAYLYRQKYLDRRPIEISLEDIEVMNELIDENEQDLQDIFDKNFILDERKNIYVKDKYHFPPSAFLEVLKENPQISKNKFIKFLASKYDIRYRLVNIDGKFRKRYVGAKTIREFNRTGLESHN